MEFKERREAIIQTASLIEQVRRKLSELEKRLDLLLGKKVDANGDAELAALLQRASEATAPSGTSLTPSKPKRKSRYPEGPPLNRRVLQFLRQAKRPCGYQDVLGDVDAHQQSIQNALRDLETRGYAMRLEQNLWIPTEANTGGLKIIE